MKQDGKASSERRWVPLPETQKIRGRTVRGKFTLHRQLYDAAVFTKRVDGVTGEEARVLTNCRHNLHTETVYHDVKVNFIPPVLKYDCTPFFQVLTISFHIFMPPPSL